jgi:hypothetical protein
MWRHIHHLCHLSCSTITPTWTRVPWSQSLYPNRFITQRGENDWRPSQGQSRVQTPEAPSITWCSSATTPVLSCGIDEHKSAVSGKARVSQKQQLDSYGSLIRTCFRYSPLVLYLTAFLQNTLACIWNTSNGEDQMNAKIVAQERVIGHVGNIERPRSHKSKDHFKTRSILSDRIDQAGRKIRTRKIVLHNFSMVPARHGDYRPPIDLASKVMQAR